MGSYGTLDEIYFLQQMAKGAIQLKEGNFAYKFSSDVRILRYHDSMKLRENWGNIDKNLIDVTCDILKDRILTGDIIEDPLMFMRIAKEKLREQNFNKKTKKVGIINDK